MAEIAAASMLAGTFFEEELDPRQLEILATRMHVRRIGAGETIVAEGDATRTLFLLTEGRLVVAVAVQGGHHDNVARLRPGNLFGTAAFVEGSTRAATITAEGSAMALTLEPDALEDLLGSEPAIVYHVMRVLFRARHETLVQLYEENEQLTNYIMKVHGRY